MGSTYRRTVLENGIRVVTDVMPGVRSVSMGVVVDAGPRNEPHGLEGIAHLTEHMMFQGTGSRNALEIARFVDAAGGQVGGFTSRDYSCFYATVLDDYRTFGLELLGDVLLNSVFPEESVRRQKSAILCEIEEAGDSAERRLQSLLKASVWPGHPLGRPIAGPPRGVDAITREDLIYFVQRHYTPDRLVIAAAGNLEHEDFVAQVRDSFWRMFGEGARSEVARPAFTPGLFVEQAPAAQAYFAVAVPAPAFTHESRYVWHVVNQLLGGGISSRLFREIREERGLAYNIGSQVEAFRDAGMLIVDGCTLPENLAPVLSRTLDAMSRLASGAEAVGQEELQRAKTRLRGQHLIASEDPGTRMSRLATQELYFGCHFSAEEVVDGIDVVSEEAIREVAKGILSDDLGRVAIAIVGPDASAESLEPVAARFRKPKLAA